MKKSLRHFIAISTFALAPLFTFSQVVINEYSCSNRNILADQNGDYEDYIELFNTTSSPIDLSGYYLSDDYTNLTKWTFPSGITIAGNGYLLIWASSKDMVAGTYIHTNFKLTQTKFEALAFSDPAGVILDSVTLKLTQKNHSRVRNPNGSATWGLFSAPTPNFSNGNGSVDYAPQPSMDVAPGFY